MKVDKTGPVNSTSGTRRTGGTSAARPGEFARFLGQSDAPSSVSGGNPVGSLDALLAAQSVEAADPEGRRKTRERGDDILDRLDELRHGLLGGTLSREQILALRTLVRTRRAAVVDPKLNEILDEIELRAEVEIAKLAAADSSLG